MRSERFNVAVEAKSSEPGRQSILDQPSIKPSRLYFIIAHVIRAVLIFVVYGQDFHIIDPARLTFGAIVREHGFLVLEPLLNMIGAQNFSGASDTSPVGRSSGPA